MFPYIVLALVPMILGLVYQYYKEQNPQKDYFRGGVVFLLGLTLFLMVAFRSKHVGSTDSYHYYDNWQTLSNTAWHKIPEFIETTRMETGFCYAVWGLSQFLPDPQWIFILTGLLFAWSVSHFVNRYCEDVALGFSLFITLGLYTFMVQGMRQAIAMAILLFAIDFCKKRKLLPFVLMVLIAVAFHKTAIIFLPVYFLYGIKIKPISLILFVLGAFGVVACSPFVVSLGQQWFDRSYASRAESGGIVALLVYILILLFAVLFAVKKHNDKDFSFFFFFIFLPSFANFFF